jgi:hypothetical protein
MPEIVETQGADPEDDPGDRDQDEGHHPEPDEQVHLLVDDVLRQDAQAVRVLKRVENIEI